jgi:hypothetical protein
MRGFLTSHLSIAAHALALALVFFGTAWYVSSVERTTLIELEEQKGKHIARLAELAVVTDRNGADAVTESIIKDCPRRNEFDTFLNTLNSASKKDLMITQQLFDSCGAFYAERKALMVAHLESEYEELTNNLRIIEKIRDLSPQEELLTKWGVLIESEKVRSQNLSEQTLIQGEIIKLLIDGQQQEKITELIKQAHSVSESLSVTDIHIDEIRSTLVK